MELATNADQVVQPEAPAEMLNAEPQEPQESAEKKEGDEPKPEAKPEKTPEQREIDRLRRGYSRDKERIGRLNSHVQQLTETLNSLQSAQKGVNYGDNAGDSDTLSLSRDQIWKLARELAPSFQTEAAEDERIKGVFDGLHASLGKDETESMVHDFAEAIGGAYISKDQTRPALDAVFAADDVGKVLTYLSDPDNAAEAKRLGKLSAVQAGREIAKLEAKLAAEKPQVSKAPAPLEPVRGGKPSSPLPQDGDSIDVWFAKERERMKQKGIVTYG